MNRRFRASIATVGVVGVVVLMGLAFPGFALGAPANSPSSSNASAGPASSAAPTPGGHASPAASRSAAGAPSSGPGVFFTNQLVPNASLSQLTCYASTCVNASNDPSVNFTTTGAIGVAYTAWTNDSPCAIARGSAQSEIGFTVSTNGGSAWSTPSYLGAPSTCSASVATAAPDAWEPSLASLSNGTLVLAYVAFNTSGPLYALQLGPSAWTVSTSELLFTESYNNGSTWTTPQTLQVADNPGLNASGYADERPWVGAIGNTIYVTWTNISEGIGFSGSTPAGDSEVQFLASVDGGSTWSSAPTNLPQTVTAGNPSVSANPDIVVLPNGTLVAGYATNFTYHSSLGCQNSTCLPGGWRADVVAASSSNNGTSFSVSTIEAGAIVAPSRYLDAFVDPSPQLAYGAASGQLVVTFSASEIITNCPRTGPCQPLLDPYVVFVGNSSDGGATWSPAHAVLPELWSEGLYAASYGYNPGVTVNRSGAIDLVFTYDNYSLCQPSRYFGLFCGPQQEMFAQSSDNGSTFSGPYLVSNNWTQLFTNPNVPDGEYATAVAAGGQLWLAWTLDVCPGWATTSLYPIFPTAACTSEITLSQQFTGTGVSLTFTESGLGTNVRWNVSVMGNERAAVAPASLIVSGIPTGANISWILALNVTAGYGDRYFGVPSLTSPATISSSTTVTVAYTQQYLLAISTVPSFPTAVPPVATYCFQGSPAPAWDDPACPQLNYNITPGPGANWVAPGTVVGLNVTPIGSYYCSLGAYPTGGCYATTVFNLSFQSWTGTGAGSSNTTSNSTTITANGPLNETANFLTIGYCSVQFYPSPTTVGCLQDNASMTFHESGLPANTTWTVSMSSPFGATTASSSTPWLLVNGSATIGPIAYQVWTVPASGGYWVPTSNPASPVQIPAQALVNVQFNRTTSLAGDSFPVDVATSGLPDGLPWSYSWNSTSYGVGSGNSTVTSLAAGSYSATGGTVVGSNGTEYNVTGVDVFSDIVNQSSWRNVSAPSTVTIKGPATVVLVYTPRYWVEVNATVGGSAAPASAWFASGAAVQLGERALPGFHFVAWSGTGNGATSGSQNTQSTPTIHANGPVTELANFVRNASLGDVITVSEVGLPAGTSFSFRLGGFGFTANGSRAIPGFANGSLTFQAENATDLPTGQLGSVMNVVPSFSTNPNGTLAVTGDGTIQVMYSLLDLLTTEVVGNGTIAPPSGWVANGSSTVVTTEASSGWQLEGLSTMFSYTAVNGETGAFTVDVTGPGTVVAQFSPIPPPAPTKYNLTVTAAGLPAGVEWNVTTGATGASGTSAALTILGLAAGNYTIVVPTLYVGAGTRYVPGTIPGPVTIPSTSALTVTFSTEYELTVVAGAGG
ncbi:MAG TPA: hypothetical protein VGP88_08040, partial [Thermoplasmata archaeon]|nr:hypothetical protein [Thermoplasmata archaeon]